MLENTNMSKEVPEEKTTLENVYDRLDSLNKKAAEINYSMREFSEYFIGPYANLQPDNAMSEKKELPSGVVHKFQDLLSRLNQNLDAIQAEHARLRSEING